MVGGRWRVSSRVELRLDRPRIVAILNVTPDSFSDGGRHLDAAAAAGAAWRMFDEGADVIDVGGESTRPGSTRVSPEEQIRRVVPVVRAIRALPGAAGAVAMSVDTTHASVARAALDGGVDAINDVSAGEEDGGMLALAAERGAGIILMHRLTRPEQDSFSDRYARAPGYGDVVREVGEYLSGRAGAALGAGVACESVALDPGLGFGKSVEQNLELIRRTREISDLGYAVVSGVSRKSFVGRVSLGRDSAPAERLAGSLAMSVAHLAAGARVFRVHDVREHREALAAAWAVLPDVRDVPSSGEGAA
ncbi:dihydropteroate synthase [Phycisphaerales bacterium]|nr:dihydropteroate synthase [Phycisphaerales bacterium]